MMCEHARVFFFCECEMQNLAVFKLQKNDETPKKTFFTFTPTYSHSHLSFHIHTYFFTFTPTFRGSCKGVSLLMSDGSSCGREGSQKCPNYRYVMTCEDSEVTPSMFMRVLK